MMSAVRKTASPADTVAHHRSRPAGGAGWRDRFGLLLRRAALGALAVAAVTAISGPPAEAGLCVIPTEAGSWKNYDPNTRSITQVMFRMECRDASTTTCNGDICSTTSAVKPYYFVRLYGACSPTDCDWGEKGGEALTGDLSGWYLFYYNQGFAQRWVYVRTYPEWPGWLRTWIYTDFTDPGRADYTSDDWFVPL